MFDLIQKIKSDKVVWVVVLLLSVFSLLAIYSSTGTLAYKKQGGNTEYYLFRQAFILMLGLFIMYFTHRINYQKFSKLALFGFPLAVFLLALTLIFGISLNEANRWIVIPVIGISVQSSDVAKPILILFIARLISRNQDVIGDFRLTFLPIMLSVLLICLLILPANFSTAALLFASCFVLMFVGRLNLKYLAYTIILGVAVLGLFIMILSFSPDQGRLLTWKSRVENFVNGESEDNYQAEQAKIAIATGGVFGKTPGKSTQRNFLPHPYSDFIFAIIIEEYGLAGGIILVLLYLILFFRGIKIAAQSKTIFGTLAAFGITFILVFQAFVNMAVACNLMPVTGQPLPLVSMGGTSLWATCLSLGIVLSISRAYEKEKELTAITADAKQS